MFGFKGWAEPTSLTWSVMTRALLACEVRLQSESKEKLRSKQKQLEKDEQNQNLEHFIQKARKYAELTELTPYAAHELIKAIYVGAPEKSSGKRCQSIHICYDLIGFIPLSELMEKGKA